MENVITQWPGEPDLGMEFLMWRIYGPSIFSSKRFIDPMVAEMDKDNMRGLDEKDLTRLAEATRGKEPILWYV